ncbi:MAG: DUF1254 domain-containing protein [Acidovorax sp.]
MPLTEAQAYAIGLEAYTYAYPMVLMEMTRRVQTSAGRPGAMRAPMGRFAHVPTYPDAGFRDVVRPNADTLYSNIWYDVGREPLLLTLPDTGERYHVIPFMDMFTDVFATLGTRTNGNGGGRFAVVGPRWTGELPPGVRAIASPTEVGWIIGRVQTNGAADYPAVHAIQAAMSAQPLSGAAPTPPAADPATDLHTPPPEQVERMDAATFFGLFADLLRHNPPHAADVPMLLRLERLGLVAGRPFDLRQADDAVQRALTRAKPDAHQRIIRQGATLRQVRNGWMMPTRMNGTFGNDYLQRAFTAWSGLGALPNDEAIYPRAMADSDGQPFTGEARYVLHFDQADLPPADAFWSLTMYGADQFFVDNPIHRYAIGDRDPLAYNADGSLDLYIQHASPGADKESNWLPAPAAGPLSMSLRLYLPRAEALDGRWTPPAIRRLPVS